MTDWINHPNMQELLKKQEHERQTLVEYLETPEPRFVAKLSMAGWGVIDRMTGNYVEGFWDKEQIAINCAWELNND